jgi:hypothetical protein
VSNLLWLALIHQARGLITVPWPTTLKVITYEKERLDYVDVEDRAVSRMVILRSPPLVGFPKTLLCTKSLPRLMCARACLRLLKCSPNKLARSDKLTSRLQLVHNHGTILNNKGPIGIFVRREVLSGYWA